MLSLPEGRLHLVLGEDIVGVQIGDRTLEVVHQLICHAHAQILPDCRPHEPYVPVGRTAHASAHGQTGNMHCNHADHVCTAR